MGMFSGSHLILNMNFTGLHISLSALIFVVAFTVVPVTGHCCGHCVPDLCSCYGTTEGCGNTQNSTEGCPPKNSHLCCAPKKCGDCNLFCCECSCCCSRSDGSSNSIPALDKWKQVDKNGDLKIDTDELSVYLGNGSITWTKYTFYHAKLTQLFLDATDSNSNGYIDPWEMDSELRYLHKPDEL